MIPDQLSEDWLREHVWPRFSKVLARPGVYLANHSLGRPLDQMATDVAKFTELWYTEMDRAWNAWQTELDRFTSGIEQLIDAEPGTVTQRASAGQGLRAALNSFPSGQTIRVVTTTGEFDSVEFILRAYADAGRCEVTWVAPEEAGEVSLFDPRAILAQATENTDLVVVSHVFFGTGQVLPNLAELLKTCRAKGVKTLVDLYHSAGAVPLSIRVLKPDFAIGGSYKYLRGGPGAGWLYVSPAMQAERTTLDTGWFAQAQAMEFQKNARQSGIGGWAESTPPVISTYQARSGLALTLELGVENLYAYSLQRQAMLREEFRRTGIAIFEPYDPKAFGAFSLVPNPNAKEVCERLRQQRVTADARGRVIRFCPDILNSQEEIETAARAVASCINTGAASRLT